MNDFRIRKLAETFVRQNDSYGSAVMLADFLRELIKSGSVTLNEPKFSYTFGDVTLHLTETEIATANAYVEQRQKIQGIKYIRQVTAISLKEAKDFAYGLEEFNTRVREIRNEVWNTEL